MRRLAALALLGLSCAAPPEGVPAVVRFLEVNDIHILDDASMAYPRNVVDAMNREEAALVLVCGDVATDGKEDELRRAKTVLDGFQHPWRIVIGNHDCLYGGDREETLYKTVFGLDETTYAFRSHGIHFVAIDPGCGKDYKKHAVRPATLAKLRAIAAAIPADEPVILFSHYPYVPGVTYRTPNADEVIEVFRGRRLLAVVGAHFHGNNERRENGILFTTTACATSTRNNHDGTKAKGYRVFTVREGREITTEFREVPP
jgi:calcineurin-like phosphoesterase family protein